MRIYTTTAVCDVCGCEGAASVSTAASQWQAGGFVSHSDPRVFADNLKRRREKQALTDKPKK